MSLLADLLSRIRQPEAKREVPPNLRNIVQSSSQKSANKKRIILMSVLLLASVIIGFITIYVILPLMNTAPSLTSSLKVTESRSYDDTSAKDDENLLGETILKGDSSRQDFPGTGQVLQSASHNILKGESAFDDNGLVRSDEGLTVKDEEDEFQSFVTENFGTQNYAYQKMPDEPEHRTTDLSAQRDAYLYSARRFEMNGDYFNALSHYKEALKRDKTNSALLNTISYLYLQLNLLKEAALYAQKALAMNESYIPALINLAISYARSGNYVEAEESLKRALSVDRDNQTILLNLAILYETQQDYNKALGYYARLITLGNIGGLIGSARVNEKKGENDKALVMYRDILSSQSVSKDTKRLARQRIIVLLNEKRAKIARDSKEIR